MIEYFTKINLIYFLLIVLLLVVVYFKLEVFLKRRKNKKRFKRGIKLEKAAAKFLEKKGFTIVGEQVGFTHTYKVNGKKVQSELVVDYVVSKRGKYFIVEVKSGKSAILISNKNTRRQLLEYSVAIPCDGVYLLDMENKHLQKIAFTLSNRKYFFLLFWLLIISILFLITFTLKLY